MISAHLVLRRPVESEEQGPDADLARVRASIQEYEQCLVRNDFREGLLQLERNAIANYAMWMLGHLKETPRGSSEA